MHIFLSFAYLQIYANSFFYTDHMTKHVINHLFFYDLLQYIEFTITSYETTEITV